MSICYIVGAGEFYGELAPKKGDLVIAADGGYDTLRELGIDCHLLLGDMDSRKAKNESTLPKVEGASVCSATVEGASVCSGLSESKSVCSVTDESASVCSGLGESKSVRSATVEGASVCSASVESHGCKVEENALCSLVFPVEKDETDTHLAYLEGAKRGYTAFRVYGGVGGREDHTFANYSLLLYAKNRGHSMTLVGDGYESFVIKNESVTLSGRLGATLSVFAFGGRASGVNILGAKYEARDVTLSPEFPLGVSNSFLRGEVKLSVKDGALLVMREV
ncbi:MAG: thiamine diphosphokinase [Clostridia bacterium]|nr:thiamine diphosphokinase [Clostridia bacterium]